ncbi:MAG: PilZ domain-containing protein [Candidatus Omnitrophica bacterium]|nr:PilZ domain-containing protein [Candidatus Omnitrophota bacterium]MCM8826545.1 PilZ domain-containing protein [Candidatus Omnitrophota bacterium]
MEDLEKKLLEEHWIGPNELIKAKEDKETIKKSIFASLLRLGYISDIELFMFFGELSSIPFVTIQDYVIDKDILRFLPEEFCRDNLVIPLFKVDSTLFIAMANPFDTEIINSIGNITGLEVNPLIASPKDILKFLDDNFGFPSNFFNIEKFIFPLSKLNNFPHHRESGRIPLNLPLEFKVIDDRVRLVSQQNIPATTFDISCNGKALGIKTFIFIPPTVQLLLNFSLNIGVVQAKGEVAYSRMEKGGRFNMGVKFLDIDDTVISYLLDLAEENGGYK